MANPKTKIKVTLRDDSERLLEFNGNALAEAEDLLGMPVLKFASAVQEAASSGDGEESAYVMGYLQVRDLLYAAMNRKGGRKFTREDVGDLMKTDIESFTGYIRAIFQAITVAMTGKLPEPAADDGETDEVSPGEAGQSDGTGTS